MNKDELQEILKKHSLWLYDKPCGERANLREANLREADLCGADLDYSVWPLSCMSLSVKIDKRIAAQLMYHVLRVCDYSGIDTSDPRALASEFHRFDECGGWPKIEAKGETK